MPGTPNEEFKSLLKANGFTREDLEEVKRIFKTPHDMGVTTTMLQTWLKYPGKVSGRKMHPIFLEHFKTRLKYE